PARVAAAGPKCFYFQQDHWRGSLIQSNGTTVLYEFRGHYFFDKATGDGGIYVTGFSIAGQTFDPTTLPGFPPADGQYFGPGTGGMITHDDVPADPNCAARAAKEPASIYAADANVPRCVATPGAIRAGHLGPIALGEREAVLRRAFPRARRLIRIGRTVAYKPQSAGVLVGIRGHRVRYLAIYDARAMHTRRALADYVRRA